MLNSPAGQARLQQFQQILDAENSKPQNYYGKVVDQYGNPVAGATVMGNILLNVGFESSRREAHQTATDNEGLFQFTGLHGADLGVTVRKEGYEMEARGAGYKGPTNGKDPTPADPAVFILWKLQGAEPMTHAQLDSRLVYDSQAGTFGAAFDLTTGKRSGAGELRITLTQNP
ncbi:MAG: carboxypeptidase-like regulatory domain-containing protein [Verrucomicrobiota bacterium]